MISTIFTEGDPHKAVAMLIASYDDPYGKDAAACYRAWGNTRATICRHPDKYCDPDYEHEMMILQADALPWENDFDKIGKIMTAPMGTRILFQQSRLSKYSLQNESLNNRMKNIRVVKPEFYDFVLPESFTVAALQSKTQRRMNSQLHMHHERSYYNFTDLEVEEMIQKSVTCLTNSSSENFRIFNVLASLQIVTGRRKCELISTATIKLMPGEPFQMKISGFAKMDKVDVLDIEGNDERVVPLLCRYELVNHGINLLRKHIEMLGPPGNHRRRLDLTQTKMFGRRLVHTQYRGVYIAAAFKNRKINNFYPDVSRDLFNVYALGHKPQFTTTQAYSLINVEPKN